MSSQFIPLLISLLWLCCFPRPSWPNPRATEVALVCSNRTAPLAVRPTFVSNFLAALDSVTPLVAAQGYASMVNGTGATAVYAFGECMKDLSRSDCSMCFAQCKTQVLRCLPFQLGTTGGRMFYDGCYLRYDDYSFFNESVGAEDRAVCGNHTVAGDGAVFRANAAVLVRDLSVEAPKRDGFAVGFVNRGNSSVYGLAQCWEFVTVRGCESCLADAVSEIGSCMDKGEGRVVNAGCYLRYSPLKFYDNSTDDATGRSKGHRRSRVILAVCSSVLAFALMVGAVVLFMKKKILKNRESKQLGSLLATVNKSKLNFSYETLEKATNYFHSSNKLGQGGSGSVYKGVLPDGDTVAIKRLFFNTRQWADHFFNEVNLISGIDHKNLVRLLGCSITGPESLLVYEYVSNQSLHDHLLGRKNIQRLSWEVRCNIILGTAEGLSYLHEDSHVRIIHRDIKLSNILLDEEFSAKIADFGLARFFPEDKTHISTAVAGTLGYMAPEYVVCGRLTEKADVYSFGVLVIEVISGKRNSSFTQDSFSVLQMVWNHYGTGRLGEAVDPALEGNFNEEEASRLLQIGLICAQASAELRPSMSVVVKMLTDGDEIPKPAQPPFLNPSSMDNNILPRNNNSQHNSNSQSSGNSTTQSWIDPR